MDTNRCRVLTKHLLRALPNFLDKLEACSCEIREVCIFFQPDKSKEEFVSYTCSSDELLSHYDAILDKAHLPKVATIIATVPIKYAGVDDTIIITVEGDNTSTNITIYTERESELFISPADLNRKLKCRFLGGPPTKSVAYEGHISYISECLHPKCLVKQDEVRSLSD